MKKIAPLELTEEHEAKLFKMLSAFYTAYHRIVIEKGIVKFYDDYEAYYYDDAFNTKSKRNTQGITKIGWYEFCYRFLLVDIDKVYIRKVLDPVDPKRNNNGERELIYPDNWKELFNNRTCFKYHMNMNGDSPKEHPVDWLYIEWIKLKRL